MKFDVSALRFLYAIFYIVVPFYFDKWLGELPYHSQIDYTFFYKKHAYKKHEAEIRQK